MLTQWLSKLEPVHVATTRAEREAIYRFRYTVYVEEQGRILGGAHAREKMVHDDDDEKDYSVHVYTGGPDDVTAAARLRVWKPGQVPRHDYDMLSMSRFPDIDKLTVCEMGRFMVKRSLRGKLLVPAIVTAAFDLVIGEHGTDIAFCYCAAGQVRSYGKLGMRPYGGDIVKTPDCLGVALALIPSDHEQLKRSGSLLAPLARKHFGKGKRAPLDAERYEHLFTSADVPIETDPEAVWQSVQEGILATEESPPSSLDRLPERTVSELARQGCIVDIPADTLVTKEGFGEREMFVVVDGVFTVEVAGRQIAVMGPGELFGEVAFFRDSGQRSASVRAQSDGKLLVLRRSSVTAMIARQPKVAAHLLFELARLMAERLARQTRLLAIEEPAADARDGS